MNPALWTGLGILWFLARPTMDPFRLKARSTGKLSHEDWLDHVSQVIAREKRRIEDLREIREWKPKNSKRLHLIQTKERVG